MSIKPHSHIAFSEGNFRKLRNLLSLCQQEHGNCSLGFLEGISAEFEKLYNISALPSRLIEVNIKDPSMVRLVSVKTRCKYIALSYRWGNSWRSITTTKNLDEMQAGVKVSSLTKTIQDAIMVCRKLNFSFLWVDALCIIQEGDEHADWSVESQKMALIYAQAYATIAAASTNSSDESFLYEPRLGFVPVPFRNTSQTPSNGDLLFREAFFDFAEEFETATYGSALAKRAWVMQERIFSRRTIYFTKNQIYWECRSRFGAESGEMVTPRSSDRVRMASTFLTSIQLLEMQNAGTEDSFATDEFLRVWSELVDEYSGLDLTCDKDKLPGIEGLARVASLVFGNYLSGLWGKNLSGGLLWVPNKRPMKLLDRKFAPSWSWASTSDAVQSGGPSGFLGPSRSRITLQDVLTHPPRLQILLLLGKILPCHVSLDSVCKPASRRRKYRLDEDDSIRDYRLWPSPSENLHSSQAETDSICRFDAEREAQTEFFFLQLECSESMHMHHCRGLLLKSEMDEMLGEVSYARLGVGWVSHDDWHGAPTSLVRLK